MNSMFSYGLLRMDMPVLTDQPKLTFIRSVPTLDAAYRTYIEQWLIGKNGERKSRESMLSANLDDNDSFSRTEHL